jgi:predicted N-formylglutamate amidohydrolase
MSYQLLAADEPSPVLEHNRNGSSAFVVVVDHASRRIPKRLNNLGLPPAELERHIAWDIGALAVAQQVATALDAPLIAQNYSRLVIDCNRDPARDSSIATISEVTMIPGNAGLSAEEVAARRREIFQPYHDHIGSLLDERWRNGRRAILVAQHSMTHIFKNVHRTMHAAVLYNRDGRFARRVLAKLREEPGLIIGDNEPYACDDLSDYTIPVHAERRGLACVELEIRQDLICDTAGQSEWAQRVVRVLCRADHS